MEDTTQHFKKQQESNRQSEAIKLAILSANQENLMEKLETSIKENKEQHREVLILIQAVGIKLDKAMEQKAEKSAVDKLENNQRWVVLLVVGAVITSVLKVIFIK